MAARNHHYVPQCYLKRFTDTGEKSGKLTVFDRVRHKSFQTVPRNVAAERDFNKVDLEGIAPDFLETQYATFEDQVEQALNEVCKTGRFDDPSIRGTIFAFIILMHTRNPKTRERVDEFERSVIGRVMDILHSSEEIWNSTARKAKESGYLREDASASYEEARRFYESGNYEIQTSRNHHVLREAEHLNDLPDILSRRHWCLIRAEDHAGDFITSDHPVVLTWMEARPPLFGPALGVANTDLYLPLSPKLGLVGTFEEAPTIGRGDAFFVAARNASIIAYSREQVYARSGEFDYMWPGNLQPFLSGRELVDDPKFRKAPSPKSPKNF